MMKGVNGDEAHALSRLEDHATAEAEKPFLFRFSFAENSFN
jgi:hypothetical protein